MRADWRRHDRDTVPDVALTQFRCGLAARWLPRTLAAALLVLALVAAYGFDPANRIGLSQPLRIFVIIVGAFLSLWILRRGAEMQLAVTVGARTVTLARGSWSTQLARERIERLDYESPFGVSRSWIPALVLREEGGAAFRLPAFLGGGAALVDQLAGTEQRQDLAAWADALHLRRRMGRAALLTIVGYGVAVAELLLAIGLYLR